MGRIVTFSEASALQRALRRFAGTGPGSWLFARVLHRIDGPVFRATRGRHTFSSLVSGLPVVFLTTTGARSAKRRTVPTLGFPSAEGLVVIASNFGRPEHPAWYHNLKARPEAVLTVDGRAQPVRAVEADGEQRERIWREGLRIYPGWTAYEKRAANRRIGVFVLERA